MRAQLKDVAKVIHERTTNDSTLRVLILILHQQKRLVVIDVIMRVV
jgi:hypothetical protein